MKIEKPSEENQEENKEELRKFIKDNPGSSFDEIFEMFGDHEYYFLLAMTALYEEGGIVSQGERFYPDEEMLKSMGRTGIY